MCVIYGIVWLLRVCCVYVCVFLIGPQVGRTWVDLYNVIYQHLACLCCMVWSRNDCPQNVLPNLTLVLIVIYVCELMNHKIEGT